MFSICEVLAQLHVMCEQLDW